MAISVLVADDQALVRTGFRMMLDAEQDITVVGEAVDGAEAIDLARRLRPDVTLMDVRMPRVDGLHATRVLAGRDPVVSRVVVVTTYDDDENVYTALRSGACGFLLKESGPRTLVEAVRAAASGEAMLSPSVTVRLLRRFARGAIERRSPSVPLTPREYEVVQAVARRATNAETAEALGVSLSMVKVHLAQAQRKIGARNRTEIAVWAWESGVVH